MLVTLKELLDQAKIEHKAVGAFNGTTLEAIRGIIQAAEELNCPVILQHAQSHDDIIDLEEIGPIMKYYAERAKVPVALHLDHGSSFERCVHKNFFCHPGKFLFPPPFRTWPARWRERLYAPFQLHRQAFFRKKFCGFAPY